MAAGNWRTGAGIGDANISIARRTVAAALNSASKNQQILGHPVIQAMLMADEGVGPLLGELGISYGLLTVGTGKMTTTAEGSDVASTNFSLSNSTTITPARRAFARIASDFGRALQEPLLSGDLAPDAYGMLVFEGLQVWANSLIDVVVALFPSLTNDIGTTATDLTWSAVQNGIVDHKDRGNAGPCLGLLDTVGAKDLMNDMLSLGGAVQWSPGAQRAIANAQTGAFLFSEWGCDFYLNGELDNDGTDTSGGIISPGCIATKHARVPLPREADQVVDTGFYTIEARRTGGSESRFDIVSHFAAQIRENGRGSRLLYGVT